MEIGNKITENTGKSLYTGTQQVCELCKKTKECYMHPYKCEMSCTECYTKTYYNNGKKKVLNNA